MIVWAVSIPALVVLLTALALVDQVMLWLGKAGVLPWRRGRAERRVSATGFEALHGHFSVGKAQELKQRQTSLVLRDEEHAAGRPNTLIDLDAKRVMIRPRAD